MQAYDEVQEINRIDVHLVSQISTWIYGVELDFGRDAVQNAQDGGFYLSFA
ncbi:MAG: hypothetical protein ACM3TN_05840 [Alphaproteobacteria bacterium]